jgi:hypothetical protein
MTASSEPTPTPTYRAPATAHLPNAGPTTVTVEDAGRTMLEKVRDVALILASLCVVTTTIATVFMVFTLGHALSQVGDRLDTPTPAVSCDPTYFNC